MPDGTLCQHIDTEGARCPELAEFLIVPSAPGSSEWRSCIEHVGHMLDTERGSETWTVRELEADDHA